MRSGGTLKRLSRSIEPLLQNCGRRTAAIGAEQKLTWGSAASALAPKPPFLAAAEIA